MITNVRQKDLDENDEGYDNDNDASSVLNDGSGAFNENDDSRLNPSRRRSTTNMNGRKGSIALSRRSSVASNMRDA